MQAQVITGFVANWIGTYVFGSETRKTYISESGQAELLKKQVRDAGLEALLKRGRLLFPERGPDNLSELPVTFQESGRKNKSGVPFATNIHLAVALAQPMLATLAGERQEELERIIWLYQDFNPGYDLGNSEVVGQELRIALLETDAELAMDDFKSAIEKLMTRMPSFQIKFAYRSAEGLVAIAPDVNADAQAIKNSIDFLRAYSKILNT